MYHRQHVLDVMAKHIYRVQIKAIIIPWIVVQLQMMFEQKGITPLNQLTNSLGHHSTDRNFLSSFLLQSTRRRTDLG